MDWISLGIQGGGVGLCGLALWLLRRKDEMIEKLVTNHDAHLLEALNRSSDANIKLTEALTELRDSVRGCPKRL